MYFDFFLGGHSDKQASEDPVRFDNSGSTAS